MTKTHHSFVADEERDHRQNDGAGESRQIPRLAGAETNRRSLACLRADEYASAAINIALECVDMCRPSAINASEPKRPPPTISTIIITLQSAITVQILRSFFS